VLECAGGYFAETAFDVALHDAMRSSDLLKSAAKRLCIQLKAVVLARENYTLSLKHEQALTVYRERGGLTIPIHGGSTASTASTSSTPSTPSPAKEGKQRSATYARPPAPPSAIESDGSDGE
jgi:hypothetical protein